MVEAIRRACDLGSMTTTSSVTLNRRIEQLVYEHIAACRRDAQQALERAFAVASTSRKTSSTGGRAAKGTSRATGQSGRRTRQELADMGDALYQAICAHPGETMAVLAHHLGVRTSELHLPMTKLRDTKRLRSAGQRHLTRYFPTSEARVAAA
jgi:hypothetical protein